LKLGRRDAGGGSLVSGPMFSSTGGPLGCGIGYIDNAVSKTVAVKIAVLGDADLSGSVDFNDLNYVVGDYGMTGAHWSDGDFNYDGTVDFSDLNYVIGNYGGVLPGELNIAGSHLDAAGIAELSAAGVHVVPEPGTFALLACGLIGLLTYAWRKRK